MTNDLEAFFFQNKHRLITKWTHYFDVYDRHFRHARNRPVTILEIGVSQGGSLQMWKYYFGSSATIHGVDINPECKKLEEENIYVHIGSQSDREFLRNLKTKIPKVDILIDDGGHTMRQQIVSFEELFDHVKDDGIYLCEDLHTSYWLEYGGGFRRRGTFIEYAKHLIDRLNAYHSEQNALQPDAFTRGVFSLHFYDSILVIEKRAHPRPEQIVSGPPSFTDEAGARTRATTAWKLKHGTLATINHVLRFFRLPGFRWR